jgi:hypothetical protein
MPFRRPLHELDLDSFIFVAVRPAIIENKEA